MTRTRWAGLLAAVVLVAAGCSEPVDHQYTPVEVGKLTVERPQAWSVGTPVEAPWTQGFRLAPSSVEQMQVSGDFGAYTTASEGMGTLIGQAQIQLKGFTVVQSRDVDVKGATSGRVTRFTILDNTGSQVSGEWVVAVHWPYPQSVAVSILSPQLNPDLERRVLDTIELHPVLR